MAQDSTNANYRVNRALTQLMLDHYRKALEDLHWALELEPQKADIRFLLGEVRSRLGERQLALENYRQSLALDPTRTEAEAAIRRLEGPEGSHVDDDDLPARPSLTPRTETSSSTGASAPPKPPLEIPTVSELVRTGSDETTVVAIERILRSLPEDGTRRELLKRAVLLSALHRRDAGSCWERVSEAFEKSNEALERSIRAYYESAEWDEVLRVQGLLTGPAKQDTYCRCAHALLALDRPSEALVVLEGVKEPSVDTLRSLTGVELALGAPERAVPLSEKAVEQSHRDPQVLTLASIANRTWFSSHRPLDSLVGLEEAKTQIRERVVLPLLVPEIYLPGAFSNKFLMMGPPGCGKSTIARIAAKEAHARLRTLHLTSVLNMYTGNSEANLTDFFKEAKDATSEGPVLLFVDEVDSIAVAREAMTQSGERRLVNHFMDELDQVRAFPRLIILAATNLPFDLDTAVLRSGRLGTPIYIGPPNAEARRQLLERQLRGITHAGIDIARVADKLKWYSPADIEQGFATLRYSRNARRLAGDSGPVTESSLLEVFEEIVPSVRNWLLRLSERLEKDPSLEGFVTGELLHDLEEFHKKPEKSKTGAEVQGSMFG